MGPGLYLHLRRKHCTSVRRENKACISKHCSIIRVAREIPSGHAASGALRVSLCNALCLETLYMQYLYPSEALQSPFNHRYRIYLPCLCYT